MSSSGKIILRSSDGVSLEVEDEVALKSQTMEHMIEEGFVEHGIPLPNVTSQILSKVIEYCEKHVEADGASSIANDDLKAWDTKFVKVDQATLFDLIPAANFMHIKGLLDLTCQAVDDVIIMPKPEDIRKIFKIKDEFTPEEEVRRENQWAFE